MREEGPARPPAPGATWAALAGIDPASLGVADLVEAREHLGDLRRAAWGTRLGLLLWPLFGLFDFLQAEYVGVGRLEVLLALRAAPMPVIAALALRLGRHPPPGKRAFERMLLLLLLVLSTTVALMCLETGGLSSIYAAGILLVGAGLLFVPGPLRRNLRVLALVILPYPAVMFGSTLFLPAMKAQLADPRALAISVQYHFVGIAIGAFIAAVTHSLFRMRRELLRTRNIGRYRLRHQLGKGGMGEVWAAYHVTLERDVAVKVLRAGIEPDDVTTRRFEREVRATAELTHPNTVRVFDHGATEEGLLYYAMELLRGETLASLVAREGPLSPARAVHFARQAAGALAEAHARGIVHRDVKPENLFVTAIGGEGDFVKVLDFGIASVGGEDTAMALTRTGAIAGTATTMSPEVILGHAATPTADVYGLGAVLYFMLTGTLPFGDVAASATLVAHVNAALVPPSVRRGEPLPRELEALVERCLAKEASARFADGHALAEALDELPLPERFRPPAMLEAVAPPGSLPPAVGSSPTRTVRRLRR